MNSSDENFMTLIVFHIEEVEKALTQISILVGTRPEIIRTRATNSAMDGALAASKLKIQVGHVEAGCRSYDYDMLEKNVRLVISRFASIHFSPTYNTFLNLLRERIAPRKRLIRTFDN